MFDASLIHFSPLQASEKAIILAVKLSVLVCGVLSTVLAVSTDYVNMLWILSADILYCMMVPQVICVFYLQEWVNGFGACLGAAVALLLRILVGEPMIGLPSVLPLPWDKILEDGQLQHLFPFRTAIMLITLLNILVASRLSECVLRGRGGHGQNAKDEDYLEPVGEEVEEEENGGQTQWNCAKGAVELSLSEKF